MRETADVVGNAERHAVVLGAGFAGLFAARVLSEFYGRVTVLDRDVLDAGPEARRGVPQRDQGHELLARGQLIAEELFPGLTADLVAAGAHTGDLSENARWILEGRRLEKVRSGLSMVTCTRSFRERHLRARVEALPQVTVLDGVTVLRPVATPDGRAVTGVVIARDGAEETLGADLVVDATGRGSRAPVWLEELGYGRVEEERHRVDLGYATCYYRTPPGAFGDDISINTLASAEIPRGGSTQKVDEGRTIVTVYGILGDYPPVDREGFHAFVASLATPDIAEIVAVSEPLTTPVRYRFPANLRRHYERMTAFPDGLLVIGDAVCSFNPRYGQGMTVAALEALTLRAHLSGRERPAPVAFFDELCASVVNDVWDIVITTDLVFPGVEGDRDDGVRFIHEHVARLQAAGTRNGDIAVACLRVFGLVDPPAALFDQGLLDAVAREEEHEKTTATA
ncbi:FAD-dependent monooxygenase [Streptosporangium sp. NPDC023615]|uniref:FAD-dependent oxidoreductase n=1 Tax=Streptosporangium sp. NPDC023615 TaxID=3154794 RepID=UPI00343BCDE9